MQQDQNTSLFGIQIDGNLSMTLKSAVSWAKALAICGFILGGLCIVFAIVMQSRLNTVRSEFGTTEYERSQAGLAGTVGMLFYIIIGLVYIVSSVFAITFANKTSAGLNTNDAVTLNSGLSSMRNYFAFWTIMMIISLLIILIAIMTIAT